MGNFIQTKIYTVDDLKTLEEEDLKNYIVALIKENKRNDLERALDELKERKGTVDLYYKKQYTLPYIVLLAQLENNYDIMGFLLTRYVFNLNKKILDTFEGNVFYKLCIDGYPVDIKLCQLLVDYGADVNFVGKYQLEYEDRFSQQFFTSLDIVSDKAVKNFLLKNGGKKFYELPRKHICPECKKDIIV